MIEGEEEFVDPGLGEELAAEELPEPDPDEVLWDDSSPEDHVGGLLVGDAQRTFIMSEDGTATRYRVGYNPEQGIVFDRLAEGATEPASVGWDEVPDKVRKAGDELLIEYVPEAEEVLSKQAEQETDTD